MPSDYLRERQQRTARKRHQASDKHTKPTISQTSILEEVTTESRVENAAQFVRFENTYQMVPNQAFPVLTVGNIIKDIFESNLAESRYNEEQGRNLCRMLSEMIKLKVKLLNLRRFKIVCVVHIGELHNQSISVGSRCVWDSFKDNYAFHEFRNNSLFALGIVYGLYFE